MQKAPTERDLYRDVSIIGELFPLFMSRYQQIIKNHNLVDICQIIDFSSASLEGNMSDLAAFGHLKNHRTDKRQISFGIETGINGVPTALTIQRGNMNDAKHMRKMLKVVPKITTKGTVYIFDCGGNSPWIKDAILKMKMNYLTFKRKKVGTYKKYINEFNSAEKTTIKIGNKEYLGVKLSSPRKMNFFMYIFPRICARFN